MTTEERLEKLERELAFAKRCNRWLVALGAIFAFFVVAWGMSGKRVVRASGFALEDNEGRLRAALVVSKDGPGLGLRDENGKTRAVLTAGKGGPWLALNDENEKPRAVLIALGDGPLLRLYDENGKPVATVPH